MKIFKGVVKVAGYPGRDNVLMIPRGLPGCGKSTIGQQFVAQDPDHRFMLGRDDIRHIAKCLPVGTQAQETAITIMMDGAVENLLRHGWDVYVDATHIQPGTLEYWVGLADRVGVRHEIVDLTHISPEECIRRDEARRDAGGRYVGADVIDAMYQEYLAPKQ